MAEQVSPRVAAWRRQAERDLLQAKSSLDAGLNEWACYAAFQSVEKILKAAAMHLYIDPGREHNVVALAQRLAAPGLDLFAEGMSEDLYQLNQYNTLTRYPLGDETIPPADLFTLAQAARAIAAAERMHRIITERLFTIAEGKAADVSC